MFSQKKGDLSEAILVIAIMMGGIIISVWYISYVEEMTLQDQNTVFNNLNKFTKYYNILCLADKVHIEKAYFDIGKKDFKVIFNRSKVCMQGDNFIISCNELLCKGDYIEEFLLEEENFFDFKKENGIIEITKY